MHDPADAQWLADLAERSGGREQAYTLLERMLSGQTHLLGAIDFFWLTGWLLVALMIVIWFARPPFGAARTAPVE